MPTTNWNNRSEPSTTFTDRSLPTSTWSDRTVITPSFLLKEDAFYLLLESGGKIILDSPFGPDSIWTDRT